MIDTGTKAPERMPESVNIALQGIKTDSDLARLLTALITDTICQAIDRNVTTAACNAVGKLLKTIEIRQRANKRILLTLNDSESEEERKAALAKLTDDERKLLGL